MSIRPEQARPGYPRGVVEDTNAVVRVKLRFSSAEAAPVAEVMFNNGGPEFAHSVAQHVSNYRLPCLPSGSEFVGVQEFQFVVKERVAAVQSSRTRNVDGYRTLPSECLVQIGLVPPPNYRFSTETSLGSVIVRLEFSAPDTAPAVAVLYDGGQRRMSEAVKYSVLQYRMPCLQPGDPPLVARQRFVFRDEGSAATQLVPAMALTHLLGLVKNIKQQTVRFDFTTMGCPFEVRLAPYQPYATNEVSEVGRSDAGRREFIEWLRNVTIDLPPRIMKTAIGGSTTVSVPCVLLDFN